MNIAQSEHRRSPLLRVSDRALGRVLDACFLLTAVHLLGWSAHEAGRQGEWTRELTISCCVTLTWIWNTFTLWMLPPAKSRKPRGVLEQLLKLTGTALVFYAAVIGNLGLLEVPIPHVLWKPLLLLIPVIVLLIPCWLRRSDTAEREATEPESAA